MRPEGQILIFGVFDADSLVGGVVVADHLGQDPLLVPVHGLHPRRHLVALFGHVVAAGWGRPAQRRGAGGVNTQKSYECLRLQWAREQSSTSRIISSICQSSFSLDWVLHRLTNLNIQHLAARTEERRCSTSHMKRKKMIYFKWQLEGCKDVCLGFKQ